MLELVTTDIYKTDAPPLVHIGILRGDSSRGDQGVQEYTVIR